MPSEDPDNAGPTVSETGRCDPLGWVDFALRAAWECVIEGGLGLLAELFIWW